jgi:Flp pilus assembly protein TadG
VTGDPRDEAGSMLVEVVLYVPLVALLIWLVLWAGTAGQTPGELELAASDAARSAAATRDPTARAARADQLATDRLASVCDALTVHTVQDGQLVTVTIRCQLRTDPMRGLDVGTRTFEAVGLSTVDRYIVLEAGA